VCERVAATALLAEAEADVPTADARVALEGLVRIRSREGPRGHAALSLGWLALVQRQAAALEHLQVGQYSY
jgi:hypothetical protein